MKRPVIIGYGNAVREDDGSGWRAADLLASHPGLGAAEIIQSVISYCPSWRRMANASVVVFLDAAVDHSPGEVRSEGVEADR